MEKHIKRFNQRRNSGNSGGNTKPTLRIGDLPFGPRMPGIGILGSSSHRVNQNKMPNIDVSDLKKFLTPALSQSSISLLSKKEKAFERLKNKIDNNLPIKLEEIFMFTHNLDSVEGLRNWSINVPNRIIPAILLAEDDRFTDKKILEYFRNNQEKINQLTEPFIDMVQRLSSLDMSPLAKYLVYLDKTFDDNLKIDNFKEFYSGDVKETEKLLQSGVDYLKSQGKIIDSEEKTKEATALCSKMAEIIASTLKEKGVVNTLEEKAEMAIHVVNIITMFSFINNCTLSKIILSKTFEDYPKKDMILPESVGSAIIYSEYFNISLLLSTFTYLASDREERPALYQAILKELSKKKKIHFKEYRADSEKWYSAFKELKEFKNNLYPLLEKELVNLLNFPGQLEQLQNFSWFKAPPKTLNKRQNEDKPLEELFSGCITIICQDAHGKEITLSYDTRIMEKRYKLDKDDEFYIHCENILFSPYDKFMQGDLSDEDKRKITYLDEICTRLLQDLHYKYNSIYDFMENKEIYIRYEDNGDISIISDNNFFSSNLPALQSRELTKDDVEWIDETELKEQRILNILQASNPDELKEEDIEETPEEVESKLYESLLNNLVTRHGRQFKVSYSWLEDTLEKYALTKGFKFISRAVDNRGNERGDGSHRLMKFTNSSQDYGWWTVSRKMEKLDIQMSGLRKIFKGMRVKFKEFYEFLLEQDNPLKGL